jgi:chromosome segregation ATPase
MAEVTNDLMYEILKQIQADTSSLKLGQAELKAEMQAVRGHLIAMQQDIHNIYASIGRLDTRVDRIERRLELVEPAGA